MAEYKHLFGAGAKSSDETKSSDEISLSPLSIDKLKNPTPIDLALADQLTPGELLKLKAVDYAMDVVSKSSMITPEKIEKLIEMFYKNIKINGESK